MGRRLELTDLQERYLELYRRDPSLADEFYIKTFLGDSLERIVQDYKRLLGDFRPDLVLMSVGFAWEPIALTTGGVMRLHGSYPLFVYLSTEDGVKTVCKALEALAGLGVGPANKKVLTVNERTSVREIGDRLTAEIGERLTTGNLLVDITGGTKPMASGLLIYTLTAKLFTGRGSGRLYAIYVDGVFHSELRKTLPGTERLALVGSPLKVMEGAINAEVRNYLKAGDYRSTRLLLNQLVRIVESKLDADVYAWLATLCEAEELMESHKYGEAYGRARNLLEPLRYDDFRSKVRRVLGDRVMEQVHRLVSALSELRYSEVLFRGEEDLVSFAGRFRKAALYLLVDFFGSALRRERSGDHSMAVLYYYRAIEMAFQLLLASKYGLDPSNPDYSRLGLKDPERTYNEELKRFCREVGEPYVPRKMPDKLALVDCYLLLRALGDETALRIGGKELRSSIQARNTLLLVHGFGRVTERSIGKIRELSRRVVGYAVRVLSNGAHSLDEVLPLLRRIGEVM